MTHNITANWTKRWTFILAATGSAVGLGNIWKFPYITGEYGGGAFVIVYLACILGVGIPVMIAEIMAGRAGRANPVDAMLDLSAQAGASKLWGIVGLGGVIGGLMILMFYSVVAGWALDYSWQSLSGVYQGQSAETIESNFGALTGSFNRQWLWQSLFVVFTGGVIAAGVTSGIGRAVEILMPLLMLFLLGLLIYSWSVGKVDASLSFMFTPDFSKLSTEAVLVALGHAFFTLSLGMGAIMAYGAYMPGEHSIGKTVMLIGALDTGIALVAGMAIFPLVFANGLEPSSGPGLMFVSLPIAFGQMPGGIIFGSVFFILVSIAALSSSISLIEPGVAWLEGHGVPRKLGTLLAAGIGWLGGIACIYSSDFFNALDHVTANYILPLGGLLIAIFVGFVLSRDRVKAEVAFDNDRNFALWHFALRYIAPLGILIVFLHSIGVI
ncbi:MAG: sodium-dependent transporter [Spongiibacteraceae bacterium]|jgi:neurotransmitter:Na+ symporter, NSS family|nr:sodium-dependent transporter [Spongiibacteraceae bacterium]